MGAFTAYARCARITRSLETELQLRPDAYQDPVERKLHDAYVQAAADMFSVKEPAQRLGQALADLQKPIDTYFETVLVNAENETVREARLALVQHIAMLPASVADLSKLQGF